MKTYITDASIILKAFSGDEKSYHKLSQIFSEVKTDKAVVKSPGIILYELGNGIRYQYKNDQTGLTVYQKTTQFPISYVNITKEQHKEILKMAYKLQTTVYDTSYHFLALLFNGTFVTCDKEYYKKASKLGNIELIE